MYDLSNLYKTFSFNEFAMSNKNAKHILVVDDEEALAQGMSIKLTSAGFTVTTAANGQEALELCQQSSFDLILLDLMMPKVDGFAVLTELKKINYPAPVIVTSNLNQQTDIEETERLGAVEYLVKSQRSLEEIVERVKVQLDIT